ncbi:hypothetical protein HDV01_006423 [Terramyces sp. JEL0728]|nr:hypothetical protein HDV01_006423 [Terramyces sp. JEL0728]
MLLLTTLPRISAQLILETAWQEDYLCAGIPTMITVFTAANTSVLYDSLAAGYLYPQCGLDGFPVPKGCCISSLNTNISYGYQSASYYMDQFELSSQDFWKVSNDQFYCKYGEIDGKLLDWGYWTRYLNPNAKCHDGISCYNSGEIRFFEFADCTGSYQTYNLGAEPTTVDSALLKANLSVSYIKITGGQTKTIWTAFYPSVDLSPNFQWPMEIFGFICYIIAILIASIVSTIYIKQYIGGDKDARNVFFSQMLWTLWAILSLADWVTIFQTLDAWIIMPAFDAVLYNVASMIAVADTFSLILNFVNIREKKKKRIAYTLLVIIHLVLAGSGYISIINLFPGYNEIYTFWFYIFPLWNLFQFSTNTFLPIYIYYRIIIIYSDKSMLYSIPLAHQKLSKKYPSITILLPCQILNTLLYMFMSVVIEYTSLLGNDRNFMAWNGLMCLSNILHEILNLSLMVALNKLLIKIHNQEKSITSQSKADHGKIGEALEKVHSSPIGLGLADKEHPISFVAERRKSTFVSGRSIKNMLVEEESKLSEFDKQTARITSSSSFRQFPGHEEDNFSAHPLPAPHRSSRVRISYDTGGHGQLGETEMGGDVRKHQESSTRLSTNTKSDSAATKYRRATLDSSRFSIGTSERSSASEKKKISILQPAKEEQNDNENHESPSLILGNRSIIQRRATHDTTVNSPSYTDSPEDSAPEDPKPASDSSSRKKPNGFA